MLFPTLIVLLAVSTTIHSAPVEPQDADEQSKVLNAAFLIVQGRIDAIIKSLVEKVYGPTDEPLSKSLLNKPISQENQKKVLNKLFEVAEGLQWQFSKDLYKQLAIQLGSQDSTENYEIPPRPNNYGSESFTITAEEKQRAMNQPHSIASIVAAIRKAFVIAKHHAIDNVKEKFQAVAADSMPQYLAAKESLGQAVGEVREDWNSDKPSPTVQKLKDSYGKVKDVYLNAKNALYNSYYGTQDGVPKK